MLCSASTITFHREALRLRYAFKLNESKGLLWFLLDPEFVNIPEKRTPWKLIAIGVGDSSFFGWWFFDF